MKRTLPAMAWIWVIAVLAAWLAQFRDIMPSLTTLWLR
jgi:hypothetical protein